jgi:hypothetical protein
MLEYWRELMLLLNPAGRELKSITLVLCIMAFLMGEARQLLGATLKAQQKLWYMILNNSLILTAW